MGSFNMACKDIRRYLQAKEPYLDRSFIDVVQNAFLNSEELDLTPVNVQPVTNTSVPPPSFVLPPTEELKDVATKEKPTTTS